MLQVDPGGDVLGARIGGIDLAQPLTHAAFATIVRALGNHGVVCFPRQRLDAAALKRFSAHFGTLEINVTGGFQEPGHPEVMILSNIVENGRALGLADAGQDWHTDMSYSRTIAYANVLHGIRIPRRDGRPLGDTLFANMQAAYDDLPAELKRRLEGATAIHDFAKFWDAMRKRHGSKRAPLTDAQRAAKPPVSHPVFLRHPITGRKVLYANPGYTIRIEGLPGPESDAILRFLFEHQLQPKYRHAHHWSEGDVLMWDDLVTLHNAVPDYGPDEPRLIRRCQVMADRVFDADFLAPRGSAVHAARPGP
ncbi:MAG: TauD/TfdA family dioxygenase [Casimicrobiaceae bacterium]